MTKVAQLYAEREQAAVDAAVDKNNKKMAQFYAKKEQAAVKENTKQVTKQVTKEITKQMATQFAIFMLQKGENLETIAKQTKLTKREIKALQAALSQ